MDCRKMAGFKGADLEPYRGKAREEVRVTLAGWHKRARCPWLDAPGIPAFEARPAERSPVAPSKTNGRALAELTR